MFLLVSEIYSEFAIESSAGFLKAEIIIQSGVGEVSALERYVISATLYAIGDCDVVRELVGDDIVAVVRAYVFSVIAETVGVLVVVGYCQDISFAA